MPLAAALPAIIAGAGAGAGIAGGALAGRKSARTGEQASETSSTQTITPQLSQQRQGLQNLLMQQYINRLNQGLPAGYEERGIQSINETYGAGQQGLESMLAQRGLATSPVAGSVLGGADIARLGNIGQFRSGLGGLEEQIKMLNLAGATDFMGQIPYGQTMTGQGTAQGTFVQPGSAAGNAFNTLAGTLGLFSGLELFGPITKG